MSEHVIIAADSTCDLSPELLGKYRIRTLPLFVTLGGKQYRDGIDINPDFIYQYYAEHGELPKTAAINMDDFRNFFDESTKDGSSVVFFTISSSLSSTYSNACVAAQDFDNVFVVDSKNLSTGGGLLVLHAAEMAAAGKSAHEIAATCNTLADYADASFVVGDLEFLRKGGRCSSLEAFGANLLKLKPMIVVRNGKMSAGKKFRGKFSDTLRKYIAQQLADVDDLELHRVFVTHAGCEDAICQECVELVRSLAPFEEVLLTRAGCTVSSHCGANTLGVLFFRKHPVQ